MPASPRPSSHENQFRGLLSHPFRIYHFDLFSESLYNHLQIFSSNSLLSLHSQFQDLRLTFITLTKMTATDSTKERKPFINRDYYSFSENHDTLIDIVTVENVRTTHRVDSKVLIQASSVFATMLNSNNGFAPPGKRYDDATAQWFSVLELDGSGIIGGPASILFAILHGCTDMLPKRTYPFKGLRSLAILADRYHCVKALFREDPPNYFASPVPIWIETALDDAEALGDSLVVEQLDWLFIVKALGGFYTFPACIVQRIMGSLALHSRITSSFRTAEIWWLETSPAFSQDHNQQTGMLWKANMTYVPEKFIGKSQLAPASFYSNS